MLQGVVFVQCMRIYGCGWSFGVCNGDAVEYFMTKGMIVILIFFCNWFCNVIVKGGGMLRYDFEGEDYWVGGLMSMVIFKRFK